MKEDTGTVLNALRTQREVHQLMRNASPRDPLAAAAVDIAMLAIQKATQ